MKKITQILKSNIFKTVLIYTVLFSVLMGFLCFLFIDNGKGFIWNNADGLTQHYINLRYFRQLIVDFVRTGSISTFTWKIGLGMDLFSNLNYYITGDFFSYFSILFPTKSVESLYSVLIIIRMYFIGISFIAYCKYHKMNRFSTIIGSLMYTFSSFVLFSAVRHPYFSNAVMLFPLLMIGIEKMIKEEKSTFYVIIISLSFISSFYFGYMMAVIIALYGSILAIYTYRNNGIKKVISILLKTLLYSLLGILISGIILVPTLFDFFHSERVSTVIQPYSISYYRNLIYNLTTTSGSYWVYIGVQSLVFISLPIFIKNRKQNYPLFWLMIILIIPLLFSQIGSIICGFSFPNNRWIYVYSFMFSFITVQFLNSQRKIDKKDLTFIAIMVAVYFGVNYMFEKSLNKYSEIQFFVMIILLLLFTNKSLIINKFKKYRIFNVFVTLIVMFGICTTIHSMYIGSDYIAEFVDLNDVSSLLNNSRDTIPSFVSAVNYLSEIDDSYYRVSKYPLDFENLALITNYASISHFYSITSNLYKELNVDLSNLEYFISHGLKEFDYRTKITTLLGVKYHITSNNSRVPYGYSLLKTYKDGTEIYRNDYATSFATLYTQYITESDYESLTALEKESMLLKATILEDYINKENLTYKKDLSLNSIEEIEYTIKDDCEILNDNVISITDTSNNYIELEIDDLENKELYVYFDNLEYNPFSKDNLISLYTTPDSTKYSINQLYLSYKWYQPNYSYTIYVKYNGFTNSKYFRDYLTSPYAIEFDELLLNLGYNEESSGTIKISFSKIGNYTFDTIKVYAVSMDDYENDIDNLNKSNFTTIDYGNGFFEGTVNVEESGVLQFSTFYNDGFTVYVDGEKVETFVSNKYFLGINIDSGFHTIYIKYNNSKIKYGMIATISGVIIFITLIVIRKIKQNKS